MIGHTEGGSLLSAEKCGKCMTPSKQDWVYMAFGLNFGPTDMAVVDFSIIPFRSSTKNCSIHTCESDLVSQRFLTMELQGYFHTCYYLYSLWILHISIHPQSTCTVSVSLTHPLQCSTSGLASSCTLIPTLVTGKALQYPGVETGVGTVGQEMQGC